MLKETGGVAVIFFFGVRMFIAMFTLRLTVMLFLSDLVSLYIAEQVG